VSRCNWRFGWLSADAYFSQSRNTERSHVRRQAIIMAPCAVWRRFCGGREVYLAPQQVTLASEWTTSIPCGQYARLVLDCRRGKTSLASSFAPTGSRARKELTADAACMTQAYLRQQRLRDRSARLENEDKRNGLRKKIRPRLAAPLKVDPTHRPAPNFAPSGTI